MAFVSKPSNHLSGRNQSLLNLFWFVITPIYSNEGPEYPSEVGMQVRTRAGAVFAYQYRRPRPIAASSQLSNKQASKLGSDKIKQAYMYTRPQYSSDKDIVR